MTEPATAAGFNTWQIATGDVLDHAGERLARP
jgi:hypothetical protein